jgi:hypothetical protein
MLKNNLIMRIVVLVSAIMPMWMPASAWAVDSYRWFHVTIDTPWAIFIFLLPMVVAPLVLMVILYWRFALHPADKNDRKGSRDVKSVESPSNK